MKHTITALILIFTLTTQAQLTVEMSIGVMQGQNLDFSIQEGTHNANRLQTVTTGTFTFHAGYTFNRLQVGAGATRHIGGQQPVFFNTFAGYRIGNTFSVMPFTGAAYMHQRWDYKGWHLRKGMQVMYWNAGNDHTPPFALFLQAEHTNRHATAVIGFKTLLPQSDRMGKKAFRRAGIKENRILNRKTSRYYLHMD